MLKTSNMPGKVLGKNEMKALMGGWGRTYRCASTNQIYYYACPPSAACPSGCSLVTGGSGSGGGTGG
jgi:hypothetical protein